MRHRLNSMLWLAALTIITGSSTLGSLAETQINRLLADAAAASDLPSAEARLQEAETLLAKPGGGIDQRTQPFLRAEILRLRGRALAAEFQRRPADSDLRDQAKRSLLLALDAYGLLIRQCEHELDVLDQRLTAADPTNSPDWRDATTMLSRANYARAWTEYSLASVTPDPTERRRHLEAAIEQFTGFTASGYQEHPILAECFLGQALCLYELERYPQVIEFLAPLTYKNTPPETFKKITLLRLKTHQQLTSPLELERTAKSYFDRVPPNREWDALERTMALARAAALVALAEAGASSKTKDQFTQRTDEIAKRLYGYGEPWSSQLAQILGRHGGSGPIRHLVQARDAFAGGRLDQAAAEAQKGIDAASNETPDTVAADLRFTRAAALWSLSRWNEAFAAAEAFTRRHPADRRAPSMCSRAVRAGLSALTGETPIDRTQFLDFLTFAEQQFPQQHEVRRAPWYRANLMLQDGRWSQALDQLTALTAESPIHLEAQYGIALAAYRLAETATTTQPNAPPDRQRLVQSAQAVAQFAETASRSDSPDKSQLTDAIADVAAATGQKLMDLPDPPIDRVRQLLDAIDRLAPTDQSIALRIRLEIASGNDEQAIQWINQAANHNHTDPNALAALVDPIEQRFRQLLTDRPAEAKQLGLGLVNIYRQMLTAATTTQQAGPTAQTIAVRRRLAAVLDDLDQPNEAIEQYQWLVTHLPRQKSGEALRGLALACERAKRYGQATEPWAQLAAGLQAKTDGWYEAQYHLIDCHRRDGKMEHARKLLAYFRLQNPRIEPAQWQSRFDELAKTLGLP
ncbi:MAG: hypothetical protein GXY33_22185 [Phycisphaerae bacterium]|nr:hypothetical protein [Phycisphaerae bacterium]